jgi:hypothetical protein
MLRLSRSDIRLAFAPGRFLPASAHPPQWGRSPRLQIPIFEFSEEGRGEPHKVSFAELHLLANLEL